jgi:hypothetical protein
MIYEYCNSDNDVAIFRVDDATPEICTVCPNVDLMCWICIYSNIFVIGR